MTTNTSGGEFTAELFSVLPTERTFDGLPFLLPGVTDGDLDNGPWGAGNNPSVRGASAAENRYMIDGLDVTDPAWGIMMTLVPVDFVQNVEVKTGGYEPEYGGALGGVVNVVTKPGGNEPHGSVFAFYTGGDLEASARQPDGSAVKPADYTYRDVGFELGGRILRDKLWYFVGVNPVSTERAGSTLQNINYTHRIQFTNYIARLTWQINPAHRLALSGFGDPGDETGGLRRNAAGRFANNWDYGGRSLGLNYHGQFGDRLSVEATAGRYRIWETVTPLSETSPSYQDRTGTGYWAQQQNCGDPAPLEGRWVTFAVGCEGGGWAQDKGTRIRDQVRTSVAWSAGAKHEVKLGLDYRELSFEHKERQPSPFAGALVDDTGIVVDPDGVPGAHFRLGRTSWQLIEWTGDSLGTTDEFGLYLQDRWRLTPYFTLNLGLRLDAFRATGSLTEQSPDKVIEFDLAEMVAPRIGFVWDVSRQGRSRLSGSVARFYESMPLWINVAMFGNWVTVRHDFDYPSDGSLPTYTNLGTYLGSTVFGEETTVDPNLEPMFTDEYMLGFEFEAAPDLAIGTNLVYRELGNVVEDLSLDGGATYLVGNPGKTYTVNPVTGATLAEPVVFPEAVREYRALEVTVRKQLRNRWQLFGNYVYASNEGNYGGLYRQETGHLSPNVTTSFDFPELLKYAEGPLPNDRRHQLKLYGSYVLPFGLVTGFSGRYASGAPISKLGWHPGPPWPERFISPRGSAGRTPDLWTLDLHVRYPIRLRKQVVFNLIADLFNVTNNQRATHVDQVWNWTVANETTDPNECGGADPTCLDGNPSWGTPTAFQAPRAIRLGTKLNW